VNRLVNCITGLCIHLEDVLIFWAFIGLVGTLAWKVMMQEADVHGSNWRECLCSFSSIKYEKLLKHLVWNRPNCEVVLSLLSLLS
jgi:hypothetical protein